MKNTKIIIAFIFLVILLTCFTLSSRAQVFKESISKGDNVITINHSVSVDSAFLICSKYLIQHGYSFESRDASLGQLVTNARSYAGSFNYKLNFVFSDKVVTVRVQAQAMTLTQQIIWLDWSYTKMKGGLFNDAYVKFNPDILSINSQLNGKLLYSKQ